MEKQDIRLIRGDDNQLKIWLRNKKDNSLLDLTGCQLDLHALDIDDESQVVLRCSTTTGEISLLGQGEILLTIPHLKTEQAVWEKALYDLQIIDGRGLRHTVLQGKIMLYHDRTRV